MQMRPLQLNVAAFTLVSFAIALGGCGGGHGPVIAAIDFAFSGFNGTDWDIYVFRNGAAQVLVARAGDQVHPSLSWDRQLLAFEDRSSGHGEIAVVNSSTGKVWWRRPALTDDSDPEISPDGTMIVFVTRSAATGADLWLCSIDGSPLRQLTSFPGDEIDPTWSADGRAVYFSRNGSGEFDIWRIELQGTGLARITQDAGNERFPAMRASAEEIVYAADNDGDWELYYKDARRIGEPATRVTDNATDDIEPCWVKTLNQNEILYSTNVNGAWRLARQMIAPLLSPTLVDLPVPAQQPTW
jgi:TolB protein